MATFSTTNQTQNLQQRLGPISRLMTFPQTAPRQPIRVAPPATGASTGAPRPTPGPVLRPIGPGITGPAGLSPTSPAASQFTGASIGTNFATGGGGGGGTGPFDNSSGGSMMTQPTDTTPGGSMLSNVPWYVWAVIALAAFFLIAQPRELHVKA